MGIKSLFITASYICLLVASVTSCSSTTEPNTPVAPVYILRSLYEADLQALSSPGGMVRLTQPRAIGERLGYGGILLVRSLVEEQFYAYDLACPHEIPNVIQLEISDLDIFCPSCGSHYEVLHGSGAPLSGDARSPLRKYKTQYLSTTNQIRVTN